MLREWIQRSPRLVAGIWFAIAGAFPSLAWFLPSVMQDADVGIFLSFVGLPIALAWIAGAWIGAAILRRGTGMVHAMLRGMGVLLLAYALLAPCYGLLNVLQRPHTPHFVNAILMETYMVLFIGLVAVGWILVIIGGVAGLLLCVVVRWASGSSSQQS